MATNFFEIEHNGEKVFYVDDQKNVKDGRGNTLRNYVTSYVNGIDLITAIHNCVSSQEAGVFWALGGTSALHYPASNNFLIEYQCNRTVTSLIVVKAYPYMDASKFYMCYIDDNSIQSGWFEYSGT